MTWRGASNANERGNTEDRRRRREFLMRKFGVGGACHCYRCGCLLTRKRFTVDRIVPGCQGGRYTRDNIRPACAFCNSQTGATQRAA